MIPIILAVIAALVIAEALVKALVWLLIHALAWISRKKHDLASKDEIVFRRNGDWYFREAESDNLRGPFPNETAARIAIDRYCEDELGCKPL